MTENDKKTIATDIHKTLDDYFNAVRQSGLTAEFDYLDHSEDFFWVPPGYASALSYDSVAAILERQAPLFKLIDNSFDTLRIIPLSRELASYTARVNAFMTDTAGKTSNFTLLETGMVIKRESGWKLLCGQTALLDR